jgi:hypothetical protein
MTQVIKEYLFTFLHFFSGETIVRAPSCPIKEEVGLTRIGHTVQQKHTLADALTQQHCKGFSAARVIFGG